MLTFFLIPLMKLLKKYTLINRMFKIVKLSKHNKRIEYKISITLIVISSLLEQGYSYNYK
jgi:hypothetical protein